MELIYVKTDKNGTKYFHDYTCPRCAGACFCDKWAHTGRMCWECGGTGKRSVPKVVKEYTDEYWEKLQARRQAKALKEAEARAKYEEEHAEEIAAQRAEADRKVFEHRCAEMGCGKDGVGYVLTGNTYPVKDQIRRNGGKWLYGRWICPVMVDGDGVSAKRIDISEHISTGMHMWKDDFDFYEAVCL